MPLINVNPMTMQNGDVVTSYTNTVGTVQETFTFLKTQEKVRLKNNGNKNISYTIGGQSGTLGRSETVEVTGNIDSLVLSAEQGTQQFAVWADEIGSVSVTPEAISSLTTQLAQIATDVSYYGADSSKADNTAFIQQALDKGGLVTIKKAGNYRVKTLYIGSDTTFVLGDGVTLILIENTKNYLLVNKGEVATPKYRDKNIHIKGGIFNFYGAQNPKTGAYMNGLFPGHGIFLRGVDGVSITDVVNAGGAVKYAFLLVDVTNVRINNCHVENGSDGFHFQPPVKNVHISNITGYTLDNTIAFTTGDYTDYTVSEDGNGENILIENIHVGDSTNPTNEPIRFVGRGKSNTGYYDNVIIRNVTAYLKSDVSLIQFMWADTTEGNIYLKSTYLKNVEISNVSALNTTSKYLIEIAANVDNLLVKNMILNLDVTQKMMATRNFMRNIKLDNFYITNATSNIPSTIDIFTFGSDAAYKIKNLTMSNFNLAAPSAISDFTFIKSPMSGIQTLSIENSVLNFANNKGYLINYTSGDTTNNCIVNISNSKVIGAKNIINNKATLNIANSEITLINSKLADLTSVGKLRVLIANSFFAFSVDGLVSPATLSYNGTSASYSGNYTDLSQLSGDVANVTYGTYKGLYFKSGTSNYNLNMTAI